MSGCLDNRIVVVVCRGALRLDHHYMHKLLVKEFEYLLQVVHYLRIDVSLQLNHMLGDSVLKLQLGSGLSPEVAIVSLAYGLHHFSLFFLFNIVTGS